MAAKKPIIALMYDFDKTLCTTDMQAYTFIPNLGMSADAFWKKRLTWQKIKRWIVSWPTCI